MVCVFLSCQRAASCSSPGSERVGGPDVRSPADTPGGFRLQEGFLESFALIVSNSLRRSL